MAIRNGLQKWVLVMENKVNKRFATISDGAVDKQPPSIENTDIPRWVISALENWRDSHNIPSLYCEPSEQSLGEG